MSWVGDALEGLLPIAARELWITRAKLSDLEVIVYKRRRGQRDVLENWKLCERGGVQSGVLLFESCNAAS